MRAQAPILRLLCLSLTTLLILGGCEGPGAETADRPEIVATTTILGDLAARVAGDDADVEILTPIGADPCTYQPTSEQTRSLLEADLVVSSGLGLEAGLAEALDEAERRGVRMLRLGDELYPRHVGGVADETIDPYWWMDPLRAAGSVSLIADSMLTIRDGDWVTRALQADKALCALDDEIRDVLWRHEAGPRYLIAGKPGLGYFAERYDCIIADLDLSPVESLGPSSTSRDRTMATAPSGSGTSRIPESEPARRGVSLMAPSGSGGVSAEMASVYVDSLGAPGSGAETYEDMMRTNAHRIARAGQNVLIEWVHQDAWA